MTEDYEKTTESELEKFLYRAAKAQLYPGLDITGLPREQLRDLLVDRRAESIGESESHPVAE